MNAAKGKDDYLFSDLEKYQNIAILESIAKSSEIGQPININKI